MLETVPVKSLRPNPFRRTEEYPIQRDKVDALKESIRSTGFWGTIVGRWVDGEVEIAFGHHRLIALEEEGEPKKVEVIIRKLTNEEMLQMMTRENMEEYGTAAWIEMESVRAAVEGYARGDIKLGKLPNHATRETIYFAPSFGEQDVSQISGTHQYTRPQIAKILGWTRKHGLDHVQLDTKCEVAFKALELIERGYLTEIQCRGLNRKELKALVDGIWSIYKSHERAAAVKRQDAKDARKLAKEATSNREQARLEAKATSLEKQAARLDVDKQEQTATYAESAGEAVRSGKGSAQSIKEQASEHAAVKPERQHLANVDAFIEKKLQPRISKVCRDKTTAQYFKLLKKHKEDASDRWLKSLMRELAAASNRAERMRQEIESWLG